MTRALAWRRPWGRLGLRARVTVTFGLGALLLSTAMATITYFTARQFFVREREDAILRQAYVNASLARSTLRSTGVDVTQLLASLDTVPGSLSVLELHEQWYSTSISVDRDAIPLALRTLVVSGTPATQQFDLGTTPEFVVGIPLPSVSAAYFEVFTLDELARTLRILALALTGAALVTTIGGTITGRWASGRALRPLADVSRAAQEIARGGLDTRLTPADDPDLTPLAASFNEMADALQERIEREVRFTSDVSHELRSPLTTATTALEVLEAHAQSMSARSRQALALLTAELRRFRRMVDDLLEISRVDTGAAELSLEEVEVGELMRQAAAAVGAGEVPVEVDQRVAGTRLWVDKRRIERVVANLVANAEQYAGGVTRLAVEPAPAGVRLVVADRGPGIPAGERDRIFERFYRGQSAGSRGVTEGSGLGLSLVSEHVRLHGGRVWAESGTHGEHRFVVELPIDRPPPGARADEPAGVPDEVSRPVPGDGGEDTPDESAAPVAAAGERARRR
ncbi:MAG TPA: HAMP domain-containing sensor histidine kinase [Acidimicrobiales bacterium]|nr:HAMP domain-containing sensor histidine kinase [Acidimicrobiales bacterium]